MSRYFLCYIVQMPRFVVLHHVMPLTASRPSHWDLMLEDADALLTWALPLPPEIGQTQIVAALPDHRLAYLDYEGPVSGDRGDVSRWDAGEVEIIHRVDSQIEIALHGQKLQCHGTLLRLAGPTDQWRLSLFVARE